jgi:anthranilate phosphoribosyltransferase
LIREIARGAAGARDLTYEQARELYLALLDDTVPDLEVGAIMIALRMKTETVDEMRGFLAAVGERIPTWKRRRNDIRPVVIPTYNGARRAANLTPLLALLLRRQGVPVLLHGPDDNDESFGRLTSARILRHFDQPPCRTRQQAQQRLDEHLLAYLPLPLLSPGLARLLALRERLGLRNCAHSLVKMLDPFHGEGLLLAAATHPDYLNNMRELLTANDARALLLRASEGEPFANPKRRPRIEHIHHRSSDILVDGEHDSLRAVPRVPENGELSTTVAWTRRVLAGDIPLPPPLAQQLACCLYACGKATTLDHAFTLVNAKGEGN